MSKNRLDNLLASKNNIENIQKAKGMILAGLIFVDGQRIDKAGTMIDTDSIITVKETLPYVSRGGYKLAKAVKQFSINLQNKVVIDVGASTGGFTDVSLKNGAGIVHAVDVGKNLLHYKLCKEKNVINHEKINFRNIDFDTIGEKVDVIVCDVSFISLKKIVHSFIQFCKEYTDIIILIKPQFEADRKYICKGGVVRDKNVHSMVILEIIDDFLTYDLKLMGLTSSPIKGPKGNIEYLAYFTLGKLKTEKFDYMAVVEKVVNEEYSYHS